MAGIKYLVVEEVEEVGEVLQSRRIDERLKGYIEPIFCSVGDYFPDEFRLIRLVTQRSVVALGGDHSWSIHRSRVQSTLAMRLRCHGNIVESTYGVRAGFWALASKGFAAGRTDCRRLPMPLDKVDNVSCLSDFVADWSKGGLKPPPRDCRNMDMRFLC